MLLVLTHRLCLDVEPVMPARWQSSQRPLFVRTVWVNGRRHAILSRDDPLLRFPRPPSSTGASDTSSETGTCCHHLEDCLVKLRLALRPESYQGTFQETIYPIQSGTVEASHCYEHNDSDSCYEDDSPTQRFPLLGQYPKIYSFDQTSEPPFPSELQLNPLSERVLQWLDLSGKGKQLHNPLGASRSSDLRPIKEHRKGSTADFRKPHVSRRRELPTRSLSVDVLANSNFTARSADAPLRKRKPLALVVATPKSSHHEDCHLRKSPDEPPVIQTFEPPRLLRPMTAWPPLSSPNRPQLHIFMPPMAGESKPEEISEPE